jgi:hypothetical protein
MLLPHVKITELLATDLKTNIDLVTLVVACYRPIVDVVFCNCPKKIISQIKCKLTIIHNVIKF